jgi:hypothetical protein
VKELRLVLSRGRERIEHARLAARARQAGWRVSLERRPGAPPSGEAAALLALERLVLRRGRETGGDALSQELDLPAPGADPDWTLDFSGAPPGGSARRLVPLFDGAPGEDALLDALLSGRSPILALVAGDDEIVGEGVAALEAAFGLGGAIEAALSRVGTLALAHLADPRPRRLAVGGLVRAPASPADGAVGAFGFYAPPAPPPRRAKAGALAARVAKAAAMKIYRLATYAPHWRVGWRFNDGPDVLDRLSLEGPRWNVLADPGDHFYADPFPIEREGRTVLFFEDLDHRHGRGVISAVEFGPTGPLGPARVALDEPWHLSYPFLVEDAGALWMVPESSAAGDVALYRCVEFPWRWERTATLLSGVEAADSTLFRHEGRWWMTSVVRPPCGGYSDTLHLYHAPTLQGPWEPHPANPVLIDAGTARPAGPVTSRGGALWRPIQDCELGYGVGLRFARIARLDREGFAQEVRATLRPGPAWPGRKLHAWARHGRLEAIDGAAINPRWAPARRWLAARQQPAG